MTTALAMLRAAPVSRAREGRDEQHMNAIPKNKKERQFDKNAKYQRPAPICPQFSGSVNRSWPFARGDYRTLLFRCHRWRGAIHRCSIPEPRQKLANPQISCCNIGHNRI